MLGFEFPQREIIQIGNIVKKGFIFLLTEEVDAP
tara:strand:- start:108 stop:209 length:102 start_codon:yes stop_codon:yes gene_type:complete